jgi:tRNA A37 methylthiotransferase MiaB
MYIKSFQNGNPVIMAYRVTPYSKEESTQAAQEDATTSTTNLELRLGRLETILQKLTEQGGKFDGLL